MIRRALQWLLIEEVVVLSCRWLRWLDWHRRSRHDLKVWQDVWMWFMYQIVSGYPPGELRHWYEDAPPFLFDTWRDRIAAMSWKERSRFEPR